MGDTSVSVENLWPSSTSLFFRTRWFSVMPLCTTPVAVRVGVFLGRTPVRGPASVPDAVATIERSQPDRFFQAAQFALGAPNLFIITSRHGDISPSSRTDILPFRHLLRVRELT
jgi:hypothetical protein